MVGHHSGRIPALWPPLVHRTGAGYPCWSSPSLSSPPTRSWLRAALPGNRAGGRCRLGLKKILGGKKGTPASEQRDESIALHSKYVDLLLAFPA